MKHIKTWYERCEEHPDHQQGMVSKSMIQARMQEEIDELRQALETEQEPFEYWNAVEGWVKIDEVREHFNAVGCGTIYKSAGEGRTPLYTTPLQLAEQAWEKRVVKTEHDRAVEVGQAYERGWNAALAQQEPVAWISDSPTKGNGKQLHWTKSEAWRWSSNITPLYTAPPKKQWVGLTLNEAEDFYEKYTDRAELINAIDKFLEEKNHG